MSRAGSIALITIGPLAVGAFVLLLLVSGFLKLFTKDEQGLGKLAAEAAVTILFGAAVIIGIAELAGG